jgi:hypothetical protein
MLSKAKKKANYTAVTLIVILFLLGFTLGDMQILKYFGIESRVVDYSLNRINAIAGVTKNINYKSDLDKKREAQREIQNSTISSIESKLVYSKIINAVSSNGQPSLRNKVKFQVKAFFLEESIVYKGIVKTQIGGKPSQYLTIDGDAIYIAQGDGSILFSNIKDMLASYSMKSIPNNLDEITKRDLIYDGPGAGFSVKGLMIHSNRMYISLSMNQGKSSNPCWNTSIVSAEVSIKFLDFSNFFIPSECALQKGSNFSPFESGGAMAVFENKYLLLSEGAYRSPFNPQKIESIFGSVIKINLKNQTDYSIIAKGLRNPQGMLINGENLILTEQGPMGGDEINYLNIENSSKNVVNFGWPVASYGNHYDLRKEKNFPLLKSHSAYGFREPLRFWNPSIAISSITHVPKNWAKFTQGESYLIGALGDNTSEGDLSIHFLWRKDLKSNYLEDIWTLPLEERIRSMSKVDNSIFASTDSGKILIIEPA